MTAPVIPISSRRPPAATTPAPTTPIPHAAPTAGPGIGRGEPLTDNRMWVSDDVPDEVSPPSVIEIGAARRYVQGFYTLEQFTTICGSVARALAAWNAYDHRTKGTA